MLGLYEATWVIKILGAVDNFRQLRLEVSPYPLLMCCIIYILWFQALAAGRQCDWCVCIVTVDAVGAGEGQLAVDVSRDGQTIPSQVTADHPARYHVSFIPDCPGLYQIRVYFAGAEINGKRQTVAIVSCGLDEIRTTVYTEHRHQSL